MIRFPATALLLSAAIPVHADLAQTDDDPIENVIVTASRTPTDIAAVGSSVSIITGDEIRQRGAVTLAELLRDLPGLSVNQAGPRGALAQVRMRGGEANHLLVLIDGVEANDLAQGNEFNFTHLLTSGIERVEVVRGPQSALWGSDALAGVINVITVPNTESRSATATLEGGSFGTASAAVSIDGGRGGNVWSIGANHISADGTNVSRIGTEEDGYENSTLRASGRFAISDNANISAMVRYTDTSSDFDGTDFIATGLPTDADFVIDSRHAYARLAAELQPTTNINQKFELQYVDSDNTTRTDGPVDDITRGQRTLLSSQTDVEFGRQTLSLIAEYEEDEFEQRGRASFFGDPNKNHDLDRTSLATELRHDGETVNLSASFRHEKNSDFDDANTWRLTGLWRATERVGFFAAAGSSIKNPTFTERFGFFDTFIGNPDLKPEESRSAELGVRYLAENIQLSVSYFDARLEDEINGFVFDAVNGGFTAANADGESKRRGAELEGSWQATDALSLTASYTWLDATQPEGDEQLEEVRRPGDTAALRANYALPRLNINVGVTHSGEQIDTFFPPFPEPSQRVTLGAYTLIDASMQYSVSDRVMFRARIENALDETYEEVFGYRSPGFGAYAGVEFTF